MDEPQLKGVRREERRRSQRKMRVSGRMTAIMNALRKAAAAAQGKTAPERKGIKGKGL